MLTLILQVLLLQNVLATYVTMSYNECYYVICAINRKNSLICMYVYWMAIGYMNIYSDIKKI